MTEEATQSNTEQSETAWEHFGTRIVGGLAVIVLGLGAIVYHFAEDWGWIDSLYFSAVALTSVGFGDFTPTTTFTKLFTIVYIVSGISLIGLFVDHRLKRLGIRLRGRVE